MSSHKETASSAAATDRGTSLPVQAEQEPPATLGQKIFIVVLYLYVASLIWLVLSHHWYGVLPTWLDPH
jgi:hypothetical protein